MMIMMLIVKGWRCEIGRRGPVATLIMDSSGREWEM